MKEIKIIRNEFGEIVGFETKEYYSPTELEKHYPRKEYPRQWEQLDKGESAIVS